METRDIDDSDLLHHLDSIAADGAELFLLAGGKLRGALVHSTHLVNQMRANHELGVLETLILGHAYAAAGLLSTQLKDGGRLAMTIECSGPVGGISVETNFLGQVRGYLKNPHIELDKPPESFDTGPFIGAGILSITRFPTTATHPYTGQVLVEYGSIAKDLANYFHTSEQTPTAINLSVQFDQNGRAIGAGGIMVQGMAGTDPETLEGADRAIADLPSLGKQFADGAPGPAILKDHLSDFEPDIIGTRNVEFHCSCNKERFARFLSQLPADESASILREGPFPLRTTCHNCNTTYEFPREEIQQLFAERTDLDEGGADRAAEQPEGGDSGTADHGESGGPGPSTPGSDTPQSGSADGNGTEPDGPS